MQNNFDWLYIPLHVVVIVSVIGEHSLCESELEVD